MYRNLYQVSEVISVSVSLAAGLLGVSIALTQFELPVTAETLFVLVHTFSVSGGSFERTT